MEVSSELHAPATLSPGKEPRYPLDRRLGGPQSRSGDGDEEKNNRRNCTCVQLRTTPQREDVWGSEGIAPRILDLGTRWR
jgi:hypothetical protein